MSYKRMGIWKKGKRQFCYIMAESIEKFLYERSSTSTYLGADWSAYQT